MISLPTRLFKSTAIGLTLCFCTISPIWAEDLPKSLMVTQVDASVRPGDDFYTYANGPWLKATTLEAGQSAIGTSAMLTTRNRQRTHAIITTTADRAMARTPVEQKIGDYYASLLDVRSIDQKGISIINADIRAIESIDDITRLSAYFGANMHLGDGAGTAADSPLGLWVNQGFNQPDQNLAHLQQGGLGLEHRDDYLSSEADAVRLRAHYLRYIAAVFTLLGYGDADARAQHVLMLETKIAQSHASQADTDDVLKDNNLWQVADFDTLAKGLDWATFFRSAGLHGQTQFVVWQPSAVKGLASLAASEPIAVWKDYLTLRLIDHNALILPKPFRDLRLSYQGEAAEDAAQRQSLALEMTQSGLGEAIGQIYGQIYFPPRSKRAAKSMAANIITAYRHYISAVSWMTPDTKTKALAKMDTLNVGLGYPDHWTDYSALKIARGDAYGNRRRIDAFWFRHELAKLEQPVDTGAWSIQPQSVSAIINFTPNAMQFSAGLLQPPYFDPDGDGASNYGSAGAGLSHEISHSFDLLGNQYDAKGNIAPWWTEADFTLYKAASAPLEVQNSAYCPKADLCIHGAQTLSESFADLIGLQVAHDAYLASLGGKPDVHKGGLSGEQRFFIAYAQRWRKLQTDEALRQQITGDTHLPGPYRSNGVRNMDAWYQAFDIKPGDLLYLAPKDRVRVK